MLFSMNDGASGAPRQHWRCFLHTKNNTHKNYVNQLKLIFLLLAVASHFACMDIKTQDASSGSEDEGHYSAPTSVEAVINGIETPMTVNAGWAISNGICGRPQTNIITLQSSSEDQLYDIDFRLYFDNQSNQLDVGDVNKFSISCPNGKTQVGHLNVYQKNIQGSVLSVSSPECHAKILSLERIDEYRAKIEVEINSCIKSEAPFLESYYFEGFVVINEEV